MRTLITVLAVLVAAAPALAQTSIRQQPQVQAQQTQTVKFVPPPELGAKPNRPGPSADNAYTLNVTLQGINATTKQPWTTTIPVRSYAIVSPRDAASGLPTGKRMHKPFRISFRKASLQDGILGGAVAREDRIVSAKLDFKPVSGGSSQYVAVHELGHASLEVVDEYAEAAFPTYQKIIWTWVDGGKQQNDEWIVPPEKK